MNDKSCIINVNDFLIMKVVDVDNQLNSLRNNIIFEINSLNQEYFQVLMLNAARLDVFQRLFTDFDNLISSAKIVNDLQNVDQMRSMIIMLIRNQIM